MNLPSNIAGPLALALRDLGHPVDPENLTRAAGSLPICAEYWVVDDVCEALTLMGRDTGALSQSDKEIVIREVEHSFDASLGINWDTIKDATLAALEEAGMEDEHA